MSLSTTTGIGIGLTGAALAGIGIWGRREARLALARERIASTAAGSLPDSLVTTGSAARSLAEVIRQNTLETTGGRTYAETDAYLDADGEPTSDAARAAKDERTGQPLENPAHDLWLQSTTLQTALMQGYLAFRLAELTIALGAAFAAVGIGLAASGRGS